MKEWTLPFRKCFLIFCTALILMYKLKCFYFIIILCIYMYILCICVDTHAMACLLSPESLWFSPSIFYFSSRDWIHIIRLGQQGHLGHLVAEPPQWPEMLRDALESPHTSACAVPNALEWLCQKILHALPGSDVSRSSGYPQVIWRHKISIRWCIH